MESMMRCLYLYIVRLHPCRFRERFGEELKFGFDETRSVTGSSFLFADALLSLLRQWVFRPKNWATPRPAVYASSDGTRLFTLIQDSRPRSFFLLCGLVISGALFVGIVVASGAGISKFRAVLLSPFLNSISSISPSGTQSGPFAHPAGERLTEWVSAYNTGDASRMRSFVSLHL